MKSTKSRGFTLIEILVVIGIIAVLAAIVIIAINPARQFAQARNTQRTSDVAAISNALGQYMADNRGALPSVLDTTDRNIKNGSGAGIADLCSILYPTYLTTGFPQDPSINSGAPITNCATYDSGYHIKLGSGSVATTTVSAPTAELSQTINLTR